MDTQDIKIVMEEKRSEAQAIAAEIARTPITPDNKVLLDSMVADYDQVVASATQIHAANQDLFKGIGLCMARVRYSASVDFARVRLAKM